MPKSSANIQDDNDSLTDELTESSINDSNAVQQPQVVNLEVEDGLSNVIVKKITKLSKKVSWDTPSEAPDSQCSDWPANQKDKDDGEGIYDLDAMSMKLGARRVEVSSEDDDM